MRVRYPENQGYSSEPMELYSWGTVSDRVVESFILHASRGRRATREPENPTEALAQDVFNSLCDRASDLVMPEVNAGEDITAAIDAVFDDDTWAGGMRKLTVLETAIHDSRPDRAEELAREETLRDRFPWASNRGLSPNTKRVAVRCLRAFNAVSLAHYYLTKAKVGIPASTSIQEQLQDHLWFLSDAVVPTSIRRALLAHRQAAVALMSTYPSTASSPPRRENFRSVVRLLEFATSKLTGYLRVLANYPEARVALVKADGSILSANSLDVFAPFREALRRAGEGDVSDPA